MTLSTAEIKIMTFDELYQVLIPTLHNIRDEYSYISLSTKSLDNWFKKIMVAKEIAQSIGLKNVNAEHLRGEDEKGKYDFIVSRAVMPLPDLLKIVRKNVSKEQHNAIPNGVICLKGGNLDNEINKYKKIVEKTEIINYFSEEWFEDKYLIYLPV